MSSDWCFLVNSLPFPPFPCPFHCPFLVPSLSFRVPFTAFRGCRLSRSYSPPSTTSGPANEVNEVNEVPKEEEEGLPRSSRVHQDVGCEQARPPEASRQPEEATTGRGTTGRGTQPRVAVPLCAERTINRSVQVDAHAEWLDKPGSRHLFSVCLGSLGCSYWVEKESKRRSSLDTHLGSLDWHEVNLRQQIDISGPPPC